MTDNLPKKSKDEIIPDNREVDKLDQPDYRYWFDQEPLDSKRLKNKWFWDRVQLGNNIVYYADQPWLITATASDDLTPTITWYNWPTYTLTSLDIVALWAITSSTTVTWQPNITFRVNRGTYYKVNSSSWVDIAYFTPLH